MAELGVIGLMISSTATAAGVLGVIKRRCGATDGIVTLTEKCADHIFSIKELLETLEEGAKPPCDVRSISTALNQRYREFKAIEKQLGKVDRRTKRASRTERFIMAQGWLKQLEGIYNDLQHMRQGVQHLVVSWESRRVMVAAVQDTVTIDATRNAERHDGMAIWASDYEESNGLVSANNADRIFLIGVKLSTRDWKALSRFGRMDEFSLPDALVLASDKLGMWYGDPAFLSDHGSEFSERSLRCSRHRLRLLHLAAELQHPVAHQILGLIYQHGVGGVEVNLDSSILHFKIAIDCGKMDALHDLSTLYDEMEEPEMAVKYMTRAAEYDISNSAELVLLLTKDMRNVHNVAEARKWLNRCSDPLLRSFCHFFGIIVERSERKAVQLAERLKFDDMEYQVWVDKEQVVPKSRVIVDPPMDGQLYNIWVILENCVSGPCRQRTDMLKEWIDHLFDNGLQSTVVGQLEPLDFDYEPDMFECYVVRAARDGSVIAHLVLAQYFSDYDCVDQNWGRAEQHLRIAAEMGHSGAQEVCRELFGDTEKPTRGITNVEEEIELQRRALHNLSMSAELTLSP